MLWPVASASAALLWAPTPAMAWRACIAACVAIASGAAAVGPAAPQPGDQLFTFPAGPGSSGQPGDERACKDVLHEAAAPVAWHARCPLQLRVQQQRLWHCARAHCAHNQECERALVCLPKGPVTLQNTRTCTYQFDTYNKQHVPFICPFAMHHHARSVH
jgi:hypothetical protein